MDMTWEFILRIFVAALLGGAIGLEREYRSKEAGMRTHFLVALGSALFMIVSAYGFEGAMHTPEHRWELLRWYRASVSSAQAPSSSIRARMWFVD